MMNPDLALHFSRVTEEAALAAYKWIGRGDKNLADGAAVAVMRILLNQAHMNGEIIIGEGEIDQAPMLYIGEKLGLGGEAIDIAIDPIEGTRMTAMGQNGAVAVLAAAEHGALLRAPDMYMEKLATGPAARGCIDLNQPLKENLARIAQATGKNLEQLTVAILAKPRHEAVIAQMHSLGIKVFAQPDGDVVASLLTCLPTSDVDAMYGIGGAPEGVISAVAMRALGGDMQARLLPRTQVKGLSDNNSQLENIECKRCQEMGVDIGQTLTLEQLVSSDQIVFTMTGITQGELLDGVTRKHDTATTHTLVISGSSRTLRHIHSEHHLQYKHPDIQAIVR